MHIDAYQCILMHINVYQCILMHIDAYIVGCVSCAYTLSIYSTYSIVGTRLCGYGDCPTTTLVISYLMAHSIYRYTLCSTESLLPKDWSCLNNCVIRVSDLLVGVMLEPQPNVLMPYWKVGHMILNACKVVTYSTHISNRPLHCTIARPLEVPDVNCKWSCHIHSSRYMGHVSHVGADDTYLMPLSLMTKTEDF